MPSPDVSLHDFIYFILIDAREINNNKTMVPIKVHQTRMEGD
jgi:hypothetical protein